MIQLNNLPSRKSIKKCKRVGRGHGCGTVKTCGRGTKGQKSRSGGNIQPFFQGGGISLFRRVPKLGGFKSHNKIYYSVVNIAQLNIFDDGVLVTRDLLFEKGLIKKKNMPVKILGDGSLQRKLEVKVEAWSQTAETKIVEAGGKIEQG